MSNFESTRRLEGNPRGHLHRIACVRACMCVCLPVCRWVISTPDGIDSDSMVVRVQDAIIHWIRSDISFTEWKLQAENLMYAIPITDKP